MKKEKMIIRKKVQKTFKNWKKLLTIGEELHLTEERLIYNKSTFRKRKIIIRMFEKAPNRAIRSIN